MKFLDACLTVFGYPAVRIMINEPIQELKIKSDGGIIDHIYVLMELYKSANKIFKKRAEGK